MGVLRVGVDQVDVRQEVLVGVLRLRVCLGEVHRELVHELVKETIIDAVPRCNDS